jgi:hypothetical protein
MRSEVDERSVRSRTQAVRQVRTNVVLIALCMHFYDVRNSCDRYGNINTELSVGV